MQARNMRGDSVVFDLEDNVGRVVRREVLPAQSPMTEISLVGGAWIRNAGQTEVKITHTAGGFATLRPGDTLCQGRSLRVGRPCLRMGVMSSMFSARTGRAYSPRVTSSSSVVRCGHST